ncbi:SsrA-binding protein, partial [Candidatus Uhrbacteria bacterium]|nr:SsrA-binding protein [Candidatus Uhrbacteria bacterium]
MPQLANNKRGTFDYLVLEKWEVGIVLSGQEVKSVKGGLINLRGSYVTIKDEEAFLINAHIAQYAKAVKIGAYDPYRTRKLLMHKKEIDHLIG